MFVNRGNGEATQRAKKRGQEAEQISVKLFTVKQRSQPGKLFVHVTI